MNDFLDKLVRLKTVAKLGITVGVIAAVVGIYYMLFFVDLEEQIAASKSRKDALLQEKTSYEKRKVEYLAYRNEVNQLQEQQRDLLRVLPKTADIESSYMCHRPP